MTSLCDFYNKPEQAKIHRLNRKNADTALLSPAKPIKF